MSQLPLDNPNRIAPLQGRLRAAATWLAVVVLLGNVLLPPATSIRALKEAGRDTPRLGLCGQRPGDAPGKTKPALLAQHCPLCTVPAAPLPGPLGFAVPWEVCDENQPQPLTTLSVAAIRHGGMQARAPPLAV